MRKALYLATPALAATALLFAAGSHGAPVPAQTVPGPPPPTSMAICKACHTLTKGGANGIGPNLFGTVGAVAGTRPGYAASPAMKASKLKWTRANLDAYLADPRAKIPGNKMTFAGIKDPAKRKEVLDYLEKLK